MGEEESYYLLTRDFVSLSQFEGKDILRVDPQGLELLARTAMHDTSFMLLAPGTSGSLAPILNDPEASKNDKFVALVLLRNAEIAAKGILPLCQDTGTATIVAKKGQRVWTGADDYEVLSRGIFQTYTKESLRYSQTVALDMYSGEKLRDKSSSTD